MIMILYIQVWKSSDTGFVYDIKPVLLEKLFLSVPLYSILCKKKCMHNIW